MLDLYRYFESGDILFRNKAVLAAYNNELYAVLLYHPFIFDGNVLKYYFTNPIK